MTIIRTFATAALTAAAFSVGAVGIAGWAPPSAYAQSNADAKTPDPSQSDAKKKKRKGRSTLVQADKVRVVPMVQTMPLIGRLVAVRAGMVAARIDAPVAEMKYDIGAPVKKGDVIALLADDRLRWEREQRAAELNAAIAAVDTAKARLSLAKQELRRFADLKNSAAFPRARFEDKNVEVMRLQNEIAEAKANVEKARANLKLAETELSYTRITAPYDGTITRRHTEIGAFIKEGQAVFTMVSDRDLEIEVDVPANRIANLKPGITAEFQLGRTGERYGAVLRAVVPEEDLRTRTRTARFTPQFGARPDAVAANQSATLHLPIGQGREVLSVHKDAIVSVRGQPTVYVVEDGRAHARVVKVGEAVGTRFEVLDGLKDGDQVVVRGNERLRDGRRVEVSKVVTQ